MFVFHFIGKFELKVFLLHLANVKCLELKLEEEEVGGGGFLRRADVEGWPPLLQDLKEG